MTIRCDTEGTFPGNSCPECGAAVHLHLSMDAILAYRPPAAALPVRAIAMACASTCIAVVCALLLPMQIERIAMLLVPPILPLFLRLAFVFILFPAMAVGPPLLNSALLRRILGNRKIAFHAVVVGLIGPVIAGSLISNFSPAFSSADLPLWGMLLLAFPCSFILLLYGRSPRGNISSTAAAFFAYLQRVAFCAVAVGMLEFLLMDCLPRLHEFCRDAHIDNQGVRSLWQVAAFNLSNFSMTIPMLMALAAGIAAVGLPQRPRRVRFGLRSVVVCGIAAIAAAVIAAAMLTRMVVSV